MHIFKNEESGTLIFSFNQNSRLSGIYFSVWHDGRGKRRVFLKEKEEGWKARSLKKKKTKAASGDQKKGK